jgi:glycine cleavage system aminomethyltransferase T
MAWAVKLDKEQRFIGRWALEDAAVREPRERLVGFILDDGLVPTEGAVVIADGAPVGMVTSARRSPQLGCVIGMAWVPPSVAEDGASVTISDAGRRFDARVALAPFYDPEGAALRS